MVLDKPIRLSEKTRLVLKALKFGGMTYDEVIKELLLNRQDLIECVKERDKYVEMLAKMEVK